jgi:hypothetical protein
MQHPQIPISSLVREYIRRFDEGDAGLSDKALGELFRVFPENTRFEHVLLKVVAVNDLYRTRIEDKYINSVVEHILNLNIDGELERQSIDLVNKIARTPVKRVYSFATKYCSWHVPHAYPVYDGYVDGMIWKYWQLEKFTEFFRRYELSSDYSRFKRVLEGFRKFYQLTAFTFKELDKFLWLYGKEYLDKPAIANT